ncbi:hypothetical protein P692DRAFT_201538996 [Suillus brevipes Sb2]|nr:hypothetical protein P692DRAFT_201538996 [Suillus brevipes Sb2]
MPQTSVSEDRSRQPCEKHVDSVYGEGFSVIGYGNFTIGLVKVLPMFAEPDDKGGKTSCAIFSNPCTISSWKCLTGFEGPWSLIAVEDKAPFHISGQSSIFKKMAPDQ